MVRAILPANRFYARKLGRAAVDPRRVRTLDEFRSLPFTTKSELIEDQMRHSPYGTNLSYSLERYSRLHQTSGTSGSPLRWLDTPESWDWFLGVWGMIYEMIGLGCSDRLFFPFSFGPFLGFWGAFEGAARQGNFCLPGGGMTSAARLRFMLDNQATVVACTPTYALRLAEVAADEGIDLAGSPVRALVAAGEPGASIPATRSRIESAWGARVFDHTGMTEMGAVGVECIANPGGIHVIESEFIAEVVDLKTGRPAPAGVTGELVLTNLGRWGSPLIRYRTGDLVCRDPRRCPCGRPWTRLQGGILGRADDMLIIRGNNVHPAAVEDVLRSIPGVAEYRCTVQSSGVMNSLQIQVEPAKRSIAAQARLQARVTRAFQDRFQFRPDVVLVPAGALPRFEMKAQRFVREPVGAGK
jgi:phenylacetate-CoA ligase